LVAAKGCFASKCNNDGRDHVAPVVGLQ